MDPPSKQFISTLITQNEKVSWKIHNVSELLKNNSWMAYSIPMEVGLGPTDLSKWEISLHSSGKMLQGRAKLIAPDQRKVTHHLTFWLIRNGRPSSVRNPDYLKAKETFVDSLPTYWKIVPLDDLKGEGNDIVTSDDTMEIIVQLTVFGSDLSQNNDFDYQRADK